MNERSDAAQQEVTLTQGNRGFSLIELMIVVAIIGILATIAVPSYKQYVIRAQRKEAMAALQGLAQSMERFYAQGNTYMNATTSGATPGSPQNYPAKSPVDGGSATYNLTVYDATATTYTLRATPIAGTTPAGDGFLALDSTGARRWDRNNNGDDTDANENNWNDR